MESAPPKPNADPPQVWVLSCDGTALPNPGRLGIGVVLTSPRGRKFTLTEAAGRGCNNEAEAAALVAGLTLARRHKARNLKILLDSAAVISEAAGDARTTIERLAKRFAVARTLLASFEHVELRLISRRHNVEADTLARAAVGLPPKPPVPGKLGKRRR